MEINLKKIEPKAESHTLQTILKLFYKNFSSNEPAEQKLPSVANLANFVA